MGVEADAGCSRIDANATGAIDAIGSLVVELDAPGLEQAPRRMAETLREFFAGVEADPLDHLAGAMQSGESGGELVLVRDISFRSVCEHHLLPFRGRAHVAYAPGRLLAGLGAIPRVVETLASRPQLQEALGQQIVDALEAGLHPEGALVVLEATHGCLSDRGARQTEAVVCTIAASGRLSDPVRRAEVFALLGRDFRGARP